MEYLQVKVRVRQSCALSPILFSITLDFLMSVVHSLDTSFQLSNVITTDVSYANDTTLISTQFEQLGKVIDDFSQTCKKWGLQINPEKCKVITKQRGI